LHTLREGLDPEARSKLDGELAEQIQRLRTGLLMARQNQAELRKMLERMTRPPLHPAVFLGWRTTERWGRTALVSYRNDRCIVPVVEELELAELGIGDEVLLSQEQNALVGKSPYQVLHGGETALFERYLPVAGADGDGGDGRLAMVRWRDEELVVNLARRLDEVVLVRGDRLRWDRGAMVALDKLERSREECLFLEETPRETFAAIGGLDAQIRELTDLILLPLRHPELAAQLGLEPPRGVILCGPPGTGKTMLARATANWLAGLPGAGRSRFVHIKPGSLLSKWYGETEQNLSEVFRIARAAAEEDPGVPVVLFFDEVDALAAARGESLARVDDRVLDAFMAELDGFERRGNILVIAATNRSDVLDPAVLRGGRLGDLVIEVPRPGLEAARSIFGKHFRQPLSCSPGVALDPSSASREELIETAVSRLYAPNGDAEIARLTFRDGTQRVIAARDLVSGASIAKIARAAIRRAFHRAVETGECAVRVEDVLAAIAAELDSAASLLTPASCRRHLCDLSHDLDVVRVEPLRRKASLAYRVLKAAA
jgi:proteasome-associated ATPase